MEEKPVLDTVSRELGGFEAIASMDAWAVKRARSQYFEGAARVGIDRTRKVLIDKNPFHMMQVPLIHRLFPDARFILAVRHPADVLLSCYFTAFRPTPTLANFFRLDTAAEFYDLAFSTWERARELMGIEVQTIVYENLVKEPAGQLRPLTEALGWSARPNLITRPRQRLGSLSRMPAMRRLRKPIIVGLWAAGRISEHLAPVLPVLRPWARSSAIRLMTLRL